MHHDERARGDELDAEIAIADCIETVNGDVIKTEFASDGFSIDCIRGSGQRGRTQGHSIDSLARICETLAVALQHFKVCKTPVGKQHRLGALQMSVAGDDFFNVCSREVQ